MLELEIFKQLVMDSQDGIIITDATKTDHPIVYANPAFERMTGYGFKEIAGQNCRFLQGNDRDQSGINIIRESIESESSCLVTLRNYRRDKTMFWNELSLSPAYDDQGVLEYYIGIQKDVTPKVLYTEQLVEKNIQLKEMNDKLNALSNLDPSGVYNRSHFDQQLPVLWKFAERAHSILTIFLVNIDFFEKYQCNYGAMHTEECLRQLAKTLSRVFRRTSDFIARYSDQEFVVAAYSMSDSDARGYAEDLCTKIHDLHIDNSASSVSSYLTVSIGYASMAPVFGSKPDKIVSRANNALDIAKSSGYNQVVMYSK